MNTERAFSVSFAGLAFVLAASMAQAGPIIYDNMVTVTSGAGSGATNNTAIADDFVLQAGANTVADIHWSGAYFENTPPALDDFTIQIFDSNAGGPGNPVFSLSNVSSVGRMDTGEDLGPADNFDLYAYSVDIDPLTLTVGETYWLSIVHNSLDVAYRWGWGDDPNGGNAHYLYLPTPGNGWVNFDGAMDFQLTGPSSVPEPHVVLLIGLGIAGIGFSRRRVPMSNTK